jgi:hypothetical protein
MFDYVKSIKSWAHECTPALFAQIIDSKQVADICAEIDDGREKCLRGEMSRDDFKTFKAEKKKALPGFNFQAHYENGGRRLDKNAVGSGLCIYDKDHVSDPEGWYRKFVEPHQKEWGVVLAHVTPSREGVRLVFRVAKDVSLADAQFSLAKALGDEDYDGSVKDMARISFAVPRSYIIFADMEGLFMPTPEDYRMPFEVVRKSVLPDYSDKSDKSDKSEKSDKSTQHWKCRKPTERTMAIMERAMQKRGITKRALDIDGQRHFMLVNLLSSGVTRLLTREELMGAIKIITPRYAKEEDCWQLVADWYQNYRNDNKPVSQDMAWTFADVLNPVNKEEMHELDDVDDDAYPGDVSGGDAGADGTVGGDATTSADGMHGTDGAVGKIKSDFTMNVEDMPAGLRESLAGIPQSLTMPVLCSIIPLAGAYADQVEVRYADGKSQRLGLMSVIVGEQASKKSTCKDIVDIWKRQMHEDDMAQRKLEDEWKQRRKNRKANEKGEPDPQVLIREIPVTTSCSTLLKRLKNSREHCLYSFGEELDTLRKTNGAGSWSSKYDVYRLSFDRGEWGQDYNSDQAESGMVKVAYNWTILGTYGALKKCFCTDNVENGLSSRMMIAEMPDNRFAPMTTFNDMKAADDDNIQKAVETLRTASGSIDTPRLRESMAAWVEEKRVEALQAIDDVKDTYRKRAAVIGFRCGVIFSILAGEENDHCLDFARMMAEYTLKEQSKLFGGYLTDERQIAETKANDGNSNILMHLPEQFTMDDLRAMKGKTYPDGTLRQTISRWRKDGWIEKTARGIWRKIPSSCPT